MEEINYLKQKTLSNLFRIQVIEQPIILREGPDEALSNRLNVFPHNSLYKDMKDAINNVDRPDESENIDENNTKS